MDFSFTGTVKLALAAATLFYSGITPLAAHVHTQSHTHDTSASRSRIWQAMDKPYQLQAYPTSATAQGVRMPQLYLPGIKDDARPWTRTELMNDPMNFQFAVVTDRAGGIRPGVFESAVHKLNLLRPEFVMSVGDLIQGYTKSDSLLNWEWEDFGNMVESLKMPFFYVPGNHDMANPTQRAKWHELHGPNYYHFLYGDVLFLCLDTENSDMADNNAVGLSKEQLAYFAAVLKDNPKPRWTLVFMHRPLWVYGERPAPKKEPKNSKKEWDSTYWSDFEDLLKGRQHTVFAGHVHSYTKYERNDNKYFVLATTGGGSALRGIPNYGQFDHITWITMTDDGPVIANLLLSGIMDENVRTTEVAALVRGPSIAAVPVITDPVPFSTASVHLTLRNSADLPLKITLTPPEGLLAFDPTSATITIPPHDRVPFTFNIDGSAQKNEQVLDNLPIHWKGTYKTESRGEIDLDGQLALQFEQQRLVFTSKAAPVIDGNLSDWNGQLSAKQGYRTIIGGKRAWGGMKDSSLQLGAQYADDVVYIAARITDDSVIPAAENRKFKGSDRIDVYLRGIAGIGEDASDQDLVVHLKASPGDGKTSSIIVSNQDITADSRVTEGGYELEMAVPTRLLGSDNGNNWSSFQLNAHVIDRDTTGSKSAEYWWRPDWNGNSSASSTGIFVRQPTSN